MAYAIYGLVDPTTKELRYVGFTSKLLKYRLSSHISAAKKAKGKRARCLIWIKSLLNKGLKPEIFEIEKTTKDSWREAEQFWIAYFKSIGADLINHTFGGEGCLGRQHTPEEIEKRRRANTGKKRSKETINNMKKAAQRYYTNGGQSSFKGKTHSEESKKKNSDAKKGKPWNASPETKIARNKKAWETRRKRGNTHHTEETKERIRQKKLGCKLTEETKEKISKALKGKTKPPRTKEHTAKQGLSLRKYYAAGGVPWNKGLDKQEVLDYSEVRT